MQQQGPTERQIKLLCIDDDEQLLSLLKFSLQEHGFSVVATSDASRALEVLSGNSIDIVILDYRMPIVDGEAVAQEIRRTRPLLPIIMYSADLEQVPPRVFELVDEFVSKGESISNLLFYIESLAARLRRPQRSLPRFRLHIPFVIIDDEAPAKTTFRGQSSNLGEGGMAGTLPAELPVGKVVRLLLALSAENVIESRAKVAHRLGSRYGFQFLGLSGHQQQSISRSLYS